MKIAMVGGPTRRGRVGRLSLSAGNEKFLPMTFNLTGDLEMPVNLGPDPGTGLFYQVFLLPGGGVPSAYIMLQNTSPAGERLKVSIVSQTAGMTQGIWLDAPVLGIPLRSGKLTVPNYEMTQAIVTCAVNTGLISTLFVESIR